MALLSVTTVSAKSDSSILRKIEQSAADECKRAKTSKAAMDIIDGTVSDYIMCFKASDESFNEEALFQIGSMTKAFTA